MFTLTKNTNCIIKSHCFDVEGGQDCLLVSQGWIIIRRNLGTRFVCWSSLFCVVTLAERITHISHRLTLTALRSALLRGDPWHGFCQIKTENWQQYVLHLELIFLASFEEFSTLFWCSPHCPQLPHAWVHDSGSWKLWEASPGSSNQWEENQDQQRDTPQHDHWAQSWLPDFCPGK